MMMKRDLLVAAKTVDTPKTSLIFNQKSRTAAGLAFLFFKMGWQEGVNSGINEEGLAVLSSYAGTKLPEFRNLPDTRGVANESVLSQCSTVQEGLDKMEAFLKDQPSGVGGTHFLIDASGTMAVLEHEPHQRVQKQLSKTAYLVRANHPSLLQDEIEWEDRWLRHIFAEKSLIQMTETHWLEEMKKLLSSHHPNAESAQTGALCIHNFKNKGSRSKDLTLHTTETALIFDIKTRKMIYSDGPPCHNQWSILTF
nr:C45 family peptidase [Neobacillus sp. Marseille-Q6967]